MYQRTPGRQKMKLKPNNHSRIGIQNEPIKMTLVTKLGASKFRKLLYSNSQGVRKLLYQIADDTNMRISV